MHWGEWSLAMGVAVMLGGANYSYVFLYNKTN
jgi:hypothetical protein